MYISLPPRRQASRHDVHDPAHIRRERIAIEFKGQEYFESLEYPQSKEMMSLMDYSSKSANSASVPSSSKKSATVKNLPERGRSTKIDKVATPLRQLPTLPGSHIVFFVNGECQGIAYQDMYDYLQLRTSESSRKSKEKKRNREGAREHKENPFDDGSLGYYPFISLYNDARVRINPGPDFYYSPPPDIEVLLAGGADDMNTRERTWRPVCDRYSEYMREQWNLDAKEEEEAEVEAIHRSALDKAEAEKKIQRDKKRQQAEARKKAKKAAEGTQREPAAMPEDDRSEPTIQLVAPDISQSKLHAIDAPGGDEIYSPAPTMASSGADVHYMQSGYNSEHVEGEGEETREGSFMYEDSPHMQVLWTDPSHSEET
jgi:COMPASS component BRE2